MTELPLIELTGTPFERGLQQGESLSERIASNVDLYLDRMGNDAGLTPSELAERVDLYSKVFARVDPHLWDMMNGIAQGSGQSLAHIVMLNARFELLYSAWSHLGTPVSECTAFGADSDMTKSGDRIIGQNWDWFPGVKGALVRWNHDDVSVLGFTEAGIAGAKIGVNNHGIGLCVNGLTASVDDWSRGGLPFHVRTTRVLSSSNLHQAVGQAALDVPSCSANFLIGSANEGIIDVESSPLGSLRIPAERGRVLVHANHFVDPDELKVTQTWRGPSTTYQRYDRLNSLLNDASSVDNDVIVSSLRDHDGGVNAICRHPDPDIAEVRRIHTAFGVIINLTDRSLSYTDGPPCESDFVTVSL